MSLKVPRKPAQVIRTKLGKQGADGMVLDHKPGFPVGFDNVIYVDERLSPKRMLQAICHEELHLLFPVAAEAEIAQLERHLAGTLWNAGFRVQSDLVKTQN